MRPSSTLRATSSRVLSAHTIAINLAAKRWARVATGCAPPLVFFLHVSGRNPRLWTPRPMQMTMFHPPRPTFLRRKRARHEKKMERAGELMKSEMQIMTAHNRDQTPVAKIREQAGRRFYLHACPRVISGFLFPRKKKPANAARFPT